MYLHMNNDSHFFKESEISFLYLENSGNLTGNNIGNCIDVSNFNSDTVVLIGYDDIAADSIRKELYKTSFVFENINIIDIGNVINKNSEYLIKFIDQYHKLPFNVVLLGIDEALIEVLIRTFDDEFINIAFVEKMGNYFLQDDIHLLFNNSSFINKSRLLCYQTHLTDFGKMNEKDLKNSMRLGEYRNNFRNIEPLLRDTNLCFFNMDSIRYSEIPGIPNTSPSGLTSEEACQLTKYLGLNTKNNLLCFTGYQPKFDFHNQGSMMVSQMIWYYMEGLNQKIIEETSNPAHVQTYMVDLNDYNIHLKFIQSKKSGRWWVEIPLESIEQSYFMPCNEEDYDLATNNELTMRLFDALNL